VPVRCNRTQLRGRVDAGRPVRNAQRGSRYQPRLNVKTFVTPTHDAPALFSALFQLTGWGVTEQVQLMEGSLRRECQEFVEGYVLSFRREVAEYCDQVINAKGQVRGKTLNSIRDRIDRFHAMNVFGDADAAAKLAQLKQQIAGLTGQDLAQQPDVATRLSAACQAIKNTVLDPANVNKLTGRLKRRVMLD
jgi:hypothetical protein